MTDKHEGERKGKYAGLSGHGERNENKYRFDLVD